MNRPLILVTNDDGIESSGLWAAVEAVLPLGEVLVVAPDRQWSGGGRSMPPNLSGRMTEVTRVVDGHTVAAYAVDASPALAVVHGIIEFAPRRPALVVSGVNAGANLAIEVTISGTVGAALEAAAFGIPAIAVSLEMDAAYHLARDVQTDYTASIAFTRRFARVLLERALPADVDVLNVNLPDGATVDAPWRMTRLSRERYYVPIAPDRSNGNGRPGYRLLDDLGDPAPDTDIWALRVDRVVTVTPLSLDLTSRVDLGALASGLRSCRQLAEIERAILDERREQW